MGFSVAEASSLYCIPIEDYGYTRRDDWLLVSSGAGIMMAVMDIELRFRYCLDIDWIKDPRARLGDWLLMMERAVRRICVVGWFSITDPAVLRAALEGLKSPPIIYAGRDGFRHFPSLAVCPTLGDFLDRLPKIKQ